MWSSNPGKRLASGPVLAAPLLETFVAMELQKQSPWSATQHRHFHFRPQPGRRAAWSSKTRPDGSSA